MPWGAEGKRVLGRMFDYLTHIGERFSELALFHSPSDAIRTSKHLPCLPFR